MQREICVVPKSVNPARIKENFQVRTVLLLQGILKSTFSYKRQVWDFELSKEDFDALSHLKKGRLFKMAAFGGIDHPDFPWKEDI